MSDERFAKSFALSLLLAHASCATPYAYTFRLENQGARPPNTRTDGHAVVDDADLRSELFLDPTGARAVLLALTNKTEQLLQVEWTKITITDAAGNTTKLHPDVDLGWLPAGTSTTARLIPFALPPSGAEAARYQGLRFELVVPTIVRREPKVYRHAFMAQVKEL